MSLDASLIAIFFIVCGDYYMKSKSLIDKYVGRYWWIVCAIIALSVLLNFDKVEMYGMSYGIGCLFVSGSIFSILLICFLCKRISCGHKFWNVIRGFGRLSLLVFATHYYCLFVPITLKNRLLPNSLLWQDYMYWIASILICLVLVLPVSKFINNKAKWLAGK